MNDLQGPKAVLSDAYFLALQLPDRGADAPRVRCAGQDLQAIRGHGGVGGGAGADGWLVPVPGWLWGLQTGDAMAQTDLLLSWTGGSFTLTRAHVLARLEAMADGAKTGSDPQVLDDYIGVAALEHGHYAGLLSATPSRLSPKALSWLGGQARLLGLIDILPDVMPDVGPEGVSVAPDPVLTLLSDLGHGARATAPEAVCDPQLPDLLRDLLAASGDLNSGDLRGLAQELTAPFCQIDRVEDLYGLLLPEGTGALVPDWDQPWQLSQYLPALMLREDYRAVAEILERLAKDPGMWSSTPPIAWTLRRLMTPQQGFVPADQFNDILRAGLRYLDGQGQRHNGVIACADLRGAAAMMVQRLWLCPDGLRGMVMRVLMRCYGAAPAFWDAVGDIDDLPLEMANCRRACAGLSDRGDGPPTQALESALRVLQRLGVHGAGRLRLEMLGLFGVPPQPEVSPDQVLNEMSDQMTPNGGAQALLRGLAAPVLSDQTPDLSPDCPETLAEALRAAYASAPRGPHGQLQRDTGAGAFALLQAARQNADAVTEAQIDALAPGLIRLAGQAAGFAGLALGLALIQDLLVAGAGSAALRLRARLEPTLHLVVRNAGAALASAPALWGVVARMQAGAHTDTGGPIADQLRQVLALLPADLVQGVSVQRGASVTRPDLPAQWQNCPAMFDTLVVIYSCQAHIQTRIPALRASWLKDLERFGIPYVILVGSDRTALEGDVLHVAAPDSYEHLPRKTLAMVEWVARQTGFAHLLKIDDDCYLDVAAYFLDQTYRRIPYYGRRLDKSGDQIDRRWHQPRSANPAARLAFEKLPGPAIYADGGTGYALNRGAMLALLGAADSVPGQALIGAAFSEDKLMGALLGLRGITPQEEEYTTAVFRRPGPDAPAVAQWVSGFYPNRLGVTKVAHLDAPAGGAGIGDMNDVAAHATTARLAPARIWPTHMPPRLGFNSNAMHLLGPVARLATAAAAEVAVVAVVRNEMFMLRHFLAHYRALGVGGFLIVDNGSDDGTIEYLLAQPDVALFTADTEFRVANQGTDWKRALLAHYRVGRWSLVADADEMLLFSGWRDMSLPVWLRQYHHSPIDALRVRMLDMYPKGPLREARFDTNDPFAAAGFVDRVPFLANSLSTGPYSDSPTWTSAVRHRLMPGARPELFVAQKVALLRYQPWMQLSTSLHYAAGVQLAEQELLFAHFKYHADFEAKARREIVRGQYYNNAEEYRRYLAVMAAGRDVIFDADISVPWDSCAEVGTLLSGPRDQGPEIR